MSFWKNRPLIIAIVLGIILLILLFATSGYNLGERQESIVNGTIAGLQEGLYGATQGVNHFFQNLFSTTDLDKQNLELQERVAELESRLRDYESTVKENERLKELLNVKDTVGDYDVVTGQVIAKNSGDWFEEFTVNVGSRDGIAPDMIVLSADGLLGKVTAVYDSYCKIITLMNAENGVPAMVERSRDYGIIKVLNDTESKKKGLLRLEYLSANADVTAGDTVTTSGMGGMYPKGLYLGEVIEVVTDGIAISSVTVQSAVDFNHIEEVVIILEQFEETEE